MKISLNDQIDMLLMLNDKDEALQKALASGDTDLGKRVVLSFYESCYFSFSSVCSNEN